MIADTAFAGPWSCEVLLSGDYILPVPEKDVFDVDELDRFIRQQNFDNRDNSTGTSCQTSVASSECGSDDLYINVECDDGDDTLFKDIDFTNCMLSTLETEVLDSSYVDTTDWSSVQSPALQADVHASHPSNRSTSQLTCQTTQTKDRSPSKSTTAQKQRRKWCDLTNVEKVKKVEDISSTISSELGLREQLDIIRIINPNATVSPTDKEFVIDLDSISDEKLDAIEEVMTVHCQCSQVSEESSPSRNNSHRKYSKKRSPPEKRTPPKVCRKRLQKESRQRLKERRSGLFVREEILALACQPNDEDGDIDILE